MKTKKRTRIDYLITGELSKLKTELATFECVKATGLVDPGGFIADMQELIRLSNEDIAENDFGEGAFDEEVHDLIYRYDAIEQIGMMVRSYTVRPIIIDVTDEGVRVENPADMPLELHLPTRPRIVIYMEGGVIQNVSANRGDIDLVVRDEEGEFYPLSKGKEEGEE